MFNLFMPPFCVTLAKSADPDQRANNQGGVGSGSPRLFARNLNKKQHQKQHPKSGYELDQTIEKGKLHSTCMGKHKV